MKYYEKKKEWKLNAELKIATKVYILSSIASAFLIAKFTEVKRTYVGKRGLFTLIIFIFSMVAELAKVN